MKNLSIGIGFVLSLSSMAFFAHRNQQEVLKNEQNIKRIQFISRNYINLIHADTIQNRSLDTLTQVRIKEDSLPKKNSLVRANLGCKIPTTSDAIIITDSQKLLHSRGPISQSRKKIQERADIW